MFKKLILFSIFLALVFPAIGQDNEYKFFLSNSLRAKAGGGTTGALLPDGTVQLTADWNVGAFNLTAKNITAAETLGEELITNVAGFTPDVGGDWSYAAGAWTHTGAGYNIVTANWQPTAGHWYKVQYKASDTSGLTAFQMGGNSYHYQANAAVQTYYVYAKTTGAPLWGAYTAFTGNISGFTIKKVTNGTLYAHNIEPTGRVLLEEGSGAAPSLAFKANLGTGLFCYSDQYLEVTVNGSNCLTFGQNGPIINGPDGLTLGGGSNLFLVNGGAATLQLGKDSATPISQTIQAPDAVPGTNIAGANLTLRAGNPTGSGAGGSFIVATAPAGASGTTERTATTRLLINQYGISTFSREAAIQGETVNISNDSYSLGAGNAPAIIVGSGHSTYSIGLGLGSGSVAGNIFANTNDGMHFVFGTSEILKLGNTIGGDANLALLPHKSITAGSGTGLTVNSTGNIIRQVYKVTVTFAGFSAAALTADKTIATLPAKTKIVGFYADTTVPFTGGTVSAATLTVGKTAGGVEYIATHDVLSGAITKGLADADMGTELTRAAAIQGGALVNWTATTTVVARLTTVTANTNALTAGSTTFYIVTERF